MSLIPIDGNVQFVQSTTPSNPADGDVWVDTSLSPPQTKIYDDEATAFIQPRELSNLDAPVSGAGATQTDITNAVWDDDQQHGPSDLKGGVDWSSKTADGIAHPINITKTADTTTGSSTLNYQFASGGGYTGGDGVFDVNIDWGGDKWNSWGWNSGELRTVVDGTVVHSVPLGSMATDSTQSVINNVIGGFPNKARFSSWCGIQIYFDWTSDSGATGLDVILTFNNPPNVGVLMD